MLSGERIGLINQHEHLCDRSLYLCDSVISGDQFAKVRPLRPLFALCRMFAFFVGPGLLESGPFSFIHSNSVYNTTRYITISIIIKELLG